MIELYGLRFDWNGDKNLINIEKHGIPFREAATVFADDEAVMLDDEGHSQGEERFIIIGLSENLRLLMVCHCYREGGSVIRIISARKANNAEEKIYGGAK